MLTKDEFWAHLKSEGLMQEFKDRREAIESSGVTKKEAWNSAASEFGFGGAAKGSKPVPPLKTKDDTRAKKEQFQGKSASLRAEFQWVYENVAVGDVNPEDAPSSGAWGLLEFARSDPRTFYSRWLEMASKSEDRDLVMEGFREDARRSTAEIAEMLESIQSAVVQQGSEGSEGELAVSSGVADESGF